ncbi:MAG: bifunctional phosphopantothenoylcysteine decarboxylase/phosphopantothenate--cysteine ligase CoaBC [Bacteroidales bacterium]|nr:bifunctional phosphopantothenoylcysteine decarboxylase/phosphopantothenate--cysteine ligase CoaBC [Bacteroidales bacterium]
MLKGKHIVIGITGGIAAYKIPYLIRALVREGAQVRVMMTPSARDFVTPLTLATLSRNDVIFHPFNPDTGTWNSHVELGRWADLMLFAPTTANTLAKMANGIADNFVVTSYLSAKCPVMIAPSMDLDMYQHPTTQKNIEVLRGFGNIILEAQVGELASGLSGKGRMEEPENIFQAISNFFFQQQDLTGKKVLVTAGPTYEKIDPVRFIGNHSSGLMGYSIAEEVAERGGEVILISGPVILHTDHPAIRRIDVTTAAEMHQACLDHIGETDILVMAAAVADYTPDHPASSKLKKKQEKMTLTLSPTHDILKELGMNKKTGQLFVGFALETDDVLMNAEKKLQNKFLDLIVVNSLNVPGAGFGTPTNQVTILSSSGRTVTGELKPKREVATDIVNEILLFFNTTQTL